MTPAEFRAARLALGLTPRQMGEQLLYAPGRSAEQRANELERGRREVPEAKAAMIRAWLAGYRPPDWPA